MSVWHQSEKLRQELRDKAQKKSLEELDGIRTHNSEHAIKFQKRIQEAKASGKLKD